MAARKPRDRTFSSDATKTLQRVWAFSGDQCAEFLAASMPQLLGALERHGELVEGKQRYSLSVRAELAEMSPATIDSYLAPAKRNKSIRGREATEPSPLLRSSITVRKAGDEVEDSPGFFEGDSVAHCGPTLRGEYCRTMNLTDMRTGWVFTCSSRNNSHLHVLAALTAAVEPIRAHRPRLRQRVGVHQPRRDQLGCGTGVLLHPVAPPQEERLGRVDGRSGAFHRRHDDREALMVLNLLWPVVNDRMNFLTPTKKPIGWTTSPTGRRMRVYDAPQTPFERRPVPSAQTDE